MNALVYDPSRTLSALSKAFLLARGHRVSIALSDPDLQQKLETALFDVLLICNASAPAISAKSLREDYSYIAVIHLGSPKSISTQYQVHAQIPDPFSPVKFNRVMERLEIKISSEEKVFDVPVDLVAGSDRLLCRATRASASAFLLEGPPEELKPFLKNHGQEEIKASWEKGGEQFSISAELIFEETTEGRWAGLRCREGSLQSLLVNSGN